MDNPFLRSMYTRPATVLGRQLLPFSAFHACALQATASPLMSTKPETIGIGELAFAVYICTLRFEDGVPAMDDPALDEMFEKWGQSQEWDFPAEMAAFNAHLQQYLDWPDLWHKDKQDEKRTGQAWPFAVVTCLLQFMSGITPSEAWNMPLNMAVCYRAAIAESNGQDIVVEEHIERLLRHAKPEAADV